MSSDWSVSDATVRTVLSSFGEPSGFIRRDRITEYRGVVALADVARPTQRPSSPVVGSGKMGPRRKHPWERERWVGWLIVRWSAAKRRARSSAAAGRDPPEEMCLAGRLSPRGCQFQGKAHKNNARHFVHDALNSVGPMKPLAECARQECDAAEHHNGCQNEHTAKQQNL